MKLDDLLKVVDEHTVVTLLVINQETGNYEILVRSARMRILNEVLREHLNPAIFDRMVESIRVFTGDINEDSELTIGLA